MAGSRFAHPVKASAPGRANGGEAPISVPGASRATGQEGAGGGSWRRGNEPSPSPTGWRDVEAAPGGGGIEGHRGGRRWRGLRKAERKEEALPPMGSWSLSAGRRRVAEEMERGREGRGVSESPSVFECDYRPTCQRANSFPSNLTSCCIGTAGPMPTRFTIHLVSLPPMGTRVPSIAFFFFKFHYSP
jgi:hypothetical protein